MADVCRQTSACGQLALTSFKNEQAIAKFLCLPYIEAASLKSLSAAMSADAGPVEGPQPAVS